MPTIIMPSGGNLDIKDIAIALKERVRVDNASCKGINCCNCPLQVEEGGKSHYRCALLQGVNMEKEFITDVTAEAIVRLVLYGKLEVDI